MRKIFLITIALLIFSGLGISQTGWVVQSSFTTMNLYDCKSPGLSYSYISSDNGTLFRSSDNGTSWIPIQLSDTVGSLKYMYGGGNDDMYAVGEKALFGSKTSSGNSVSQIDFTDSLPDLESFVFFLGIFNYSGMIAAGEDGKFYLRDGAFWRKDSAASRIANGRNINYSSGYFFVGDSGLIMKADSIGFLHSNNERIKWRIMPGGTTKNLNSICILGSNCVAVGDDGTIIKSTNYGETWTSVQCPVQEDLYGVWLGNAYLICGANGTILRCYDFNLNKWYEQSATTNKDLYFIKTLTSNLFISGGEDGIFLKTIDGGGALKTIFLSMLIDGFYNKTTNVLVSDTIKVSLRASIPPYILLESEKGILNANGSSTGIVFAPAILNSTPYFIQVQHRNSVETWSKSEQVFLGNQLIYNFYLSADKAYGDNQKQIDLMPVRFGIYSGDVNQDGNADAADLGITDNDAFNFSVGYIQSDVNGDNIADALDLGIIDNNAFNFVSRIRP